MTKLICLGDSLTFGPGVRLAQKWTTLAASEGLHIVNMGVPGDTTAGMLARAQMLVAQSVRQLTPEQRPGVLVLGGSNDVFFSGSDIAARSNLAAIVHQLSAAGYPVLVGIPLPIVAEEAPEKWAALADFAAAASVLESYCGWLKRFCAAFDIPTVDFREDYVNQNGMVRRELYLDGLHPNAAGHQIMAEKLLEALR